MTLPGASASTPSAIATAAGRSLPRRKSTVAFSARTAGSAGVEREGAAGVQGGGVEVLDLERELGELAVALGEVGVRSTRRWYWAIASRVSPASRSSPA